jgi:hypothetical protein
MTKLIDRKLAAELFLKHLIDRARNGVLDDTHNRLVHGPPGRKPSAAALALSEWFRNLNSDDQARVTEAIRAAVDSAVFGVLVILDGASGGPPLEDVASDFALSLQTYSSDDARNENAADVSVRINPADTTEPLHDMFRWMLQDAQSQ